MESQVELKKKSRESFNKYRELIPDIGRASGELAAEVCEDGVLSGKTKRLMAMAAAETTRVVQFLEELGRI